MPSRHTFTIKPIKHLLDQELTDGLWLDPFCGEHSPATLTNDLNTSIEAHHHQDAYEFLIDFDACQADGILFDPPYSVRQVSECYKRFGYNVTQQTTQSSWYSKLKDEIARIIKGGGKVICCGWNSQGIGKTRGFEMNRILLVPHGGPHNDTIVTVETKINSSIV